jgi:hypothetical protein
MLTKEQIRNKLLNNPHWEPEDDDPDELWDLYDEVYREMDDAGELEIKGNKDKESKSDDEDTEDNDPYEYDDDEEY